MLSAVEWEAAVLLCTRKIMTTNRISFNLTGSYFIIQFSSVTICVIIEIVAVVNCFLSIHFTLCGFSSF